MDETMSIARDQPVILNYLNSLAHLLKLCNT
jgi:hypothetical protein